MYTSFGLGRAGTLGEGIGYGTRNQLLAQAVRKASFCHNLKDNRRLTGGVLCDSVLCQTSRSHPEETATANHLLL